MHFLPDIFSIPIEINLDKKTHFKTIIGQLSTIISLGLLAFAIYIYGKEVIFRENPSVNNVFLEDSNPEKLIFTLQNF